MKHETVAGRHPAANCLQRCRWRCAILKKTCNSFNAWWFCKTVGRWLYGSAELSSGSIRWDSRKIGRTTLDRLSILGDKKTIDTLKEIVLSDEVSIGIQALDLEVRRRRIKGEADIHIPQANATYLCCSSSYWAFVHWINGIFQERVLSIIDTNIAKDMTDGEVGRR